MKTKKTSVKITKTPLEVAVEQTTDVIGCFCKGLKAVKKEHRSKIHAVDTRKLTGSLDVDTSTAINYPNDNRWDYAIEHNGVTYFLEFHPASTSNVSEIIGKKNWLKWWLKDKAPLIDALKPTNQSAFHWIATGSVKILPSSKQYKQLALAGLLPKENIIFPL